MNSVPTASRTVPVMEKVATSKSRLPLNSRDRVSAEMLSSVSLKKKLKSPVPPAGMTGLTMFWSES